MCLMPPAPQLPETILGQNYYPHLKTSNRSPRKGTLYHTSLQEDASGWSQAWLAQKAGGKLGQEGWTQARKHGGCRLKAWEVMTLRG